MAKIASHRDLKVWQAGMDMVEQIYRVARQLPDSERYGLASQMTRAAVSVPANIAEGHGRGSRRDYAHFVSLARGSLMETETHLLLTVRLGFIHQRTAAGVLKLITEISKMLTALRTRLLEGPGK